MYKPNPIIIDRAVEVWKQMLSNPKYDNLGEDSPEPPSSISSNRLASLITSALPKNNDTETLEKFGEALRHILLNDGLVTEKKEYIPIYLSVDYHPDGTLQDAAKAVGLKMEFPWKTTMHLLENHLSVSMGYAAPYVSHYPLKNGRWLVASLEGRDIDKIIALIESGIITPELIANIQPQPERTKNV